MFRLTVLAAALLLAGCNSIYLQPNTMQPGEVIFADAGGYGMRRSIKQQLESRGYDVVVGKAKNSTVIEDENIIFEGGHYIIPDNARYRVKVSERREKFAPIWCALNGFWWWNFNVSISDQQTGKELLTWRGRGCANSSLQKLVHALDKIEVKPTERQNTHFYLL